MPTPAESVAQRSKEKTRFFTLIHLVNLLMDQAILSSSAANMDTVEEKHTPRLRDRLSAEETDRLLSSIVLKKDI